MPQILPTLARKNTDTDIAALHATGMGLALMRAGPSGGAVER